MRTLFLSAITAVAILGPGVAQTTVQVQASADNSLYEDPNGALSNALGQYLFCGVSGQPTARRAVLTFDVAAALPAGARVLAAELHLNSSRAGAQTNLQIDVHRLLGSWGEGSSMAGGNEGGGALATAGDVTWLHRVFPGTPWATPGGDFAALPSTRTVAPLLGPVTWPSTAALVADVQAFLDQPANNHGWLLKTDEVLATEVRRFDSRQNSLAANRPFLQVTFVAPGTAAVVGNGCVGGNSLVLGLAVIGSCTRGGSFTLQLQNGIAGNLAVHAVSHTLAATPLPLGPGCDLLLSPAAGIALLPFRQFDGSGGTSEVLAVPNRASLFGFTLAVQGLAFDASAPFGVIASNAAVVVIN